MKTPGKIIEMLIYANGSSANYHKVWGNFASIGSIWFLGCLFWSKIIYNELRRFLNGKYFLFVTLVVSVIAVVAGQYIVLPWSLLQAFTVLPFLYIGEMAHKSNIIKIQKGNLMNIVVLISLGWFITTFFDILSISAFKWKLYVIPNILFASAGVFCMYQVSKIMEKHNLLAKSFSFMGRNSIILVCFPVVETYCIPLKEIIPEGSFQLPFVLLCKTLWAALSLLIVIKTPVLRKIFGVA